MDDILLYGTLLVGFLVAVLIIFVWEFKKRQNKQRELLNAQFQQELLRTQLEIQEQTFKNISQEIHDNIGQVLSLAKLNLNTIADSVYPKEVSHKIIKSKELITKAIQDLRDLSKSLNTDFVTEAGLVKSIEAELDILRKSGDQQVTMSKDGECYSLPPQKELILFRIFQEVLNNIIKHSQASDINVLISFQPAHFSLQITDNGYGFDKNQLYKNAEQGLGIKNMENRSKIIGANFAINSEPGKGTTVSIDLPLTEPIHPVL